LEKLILIGDSWACGEWNLADSNRLAISHPGMEEYLGEKFNVINLSRKGNSNWQICYTLFNYLTAQSGMSGKENIKIILFQTDAARLSHSNKFDVEVDNIYNTADNLLDFYNRLIDIFYIKCNDIAKMFDVKIYICGACTDLNSNLLQQLDHVVPICDSWIQLLIPTHTHSVMPLQMKPDFFIQTKKYNRLDLCDQIIAHSDDNFLCLQEMLESDWFGPAIGDFHPNRSAQRVMSDYIINFYCSEI
jgi:hypothetical protein